LQGAESPCGVGSVASASAFAFAFARWTSLAAALWAELKGASARADRNAGRPPRLPLRPTTTIALFTGTLLLTSLLGAGGATLLGRMVGGLP